MDSSLTDKFGIVKTDITRDEIPIYTQEIADWLRIRYLNETNENSYVVMGFDYVEESIPKKYKLQQINTNVDLGKNVLEHILWENISEFIKNRNVKEVVGLPNKEYLQNISSKFHSKFSEIIGEIKYTQFQVDPWPAEIPDMDSNEKVIIRYSYDKNSPLDLLAADTYTFIKALTTSEFSPLISLLIVSGVKNPSNRLRMLYLMGDDEALPITNVFSRITEEHLIKDKLIGDKNGKEKV